MSPYLLSYTDLSIGFNTNDAADCVVTHFNLNIQEGGKYAIVGESGSGKSVSVLSTCRLIANALFHSGAITYQFGKQSIDLLTTDEATLREIRGKHISYIFQEPMTALNPLMTCGKQVLESIASKDKDLVIDLFEQVQLPDPERIYNSYPHQISGGQRQRVMIAMAMANNPKIIIADEPTTALDASVQHAILQLLVNLCEQKNMALVFISHDLNLVRDIANHVTVMYKGQIVEQNATQALFENPQHAYTRALLSIKPSFELKGKYLPTLQGILNNQKQEQLLWPKPVDTQNEQLIEVLGVDKQFQKNQPKVLNQLTFEVKAGETLGIVGESGCGKSTLAKVLVKLHKIDSGAVSFKGKSIYDIGFAYNREVQMIFQDPYSSLNPKHTAGHTLMEPMVVHKLFANASERRAKAIELLQDVGLSEEHFNRYPHEFSGGQRQRLCIARALSVNPEVIICDESVSALDVSVQAQILNLLKQLQMQKGLTYLFISHDLNVVSYISDRIMVLNKGNIADIADTASLLKNPKDAYTQKLLSYLKF